MLCESLCEYLRKPIDNKELHVDVRRTAGDKIFNMQRKQKEHTKMSHKTPAEVEAWLACLQTYRIVTHGERK